MVEGVRVLKAIEEVETYYGKPLKRITIEDCGPINLADRKRTPIKQLEAEIFDAEGKEEYFELIDQLGQLPEVLDARDVPSFLSEERFLRGLYSFRPPASSATDVVASLMHLIESSIRLGREIQNEFPENVTYARLIAFDLLRRATRSGSEYEALWGGKNFALMITEEMIRRGVPSTEFDTLEDIMADMAEIAAEIVRKAEGGPDYKPQSHIWDYMSRLTDAIVKRAMDISEYGDTFPYSAMIAHEVIKISEIESRTFSDMLETVEPSRNDMLSVVTTAMDLIKDVMDTVDLCESVEKEKGEKTINWVNRILRQLVRDSITE